MIHRLHALRILLIATLLTAALGLAIAPPAAVQAQAAPGGVVAFLGTDQQGLTDLYLLDLATLTLARLEAPVTPESDLAWQPDGTLLAFTTEDGGYGLLRSFRGCFGVERVCEDIVYVIPPFVISQLEWSPGGAALFFLTDEGVKYGEPRAARARDFRDVPVTCDEGIEIAPQAFHLLCAASTPEGNTRVTTYRMGAGDALTSLTPQDTLGVFLQVTARDMGAQGESVIGTQERGGDSGFYSAPGGDARRLSPYQVHLYTAAFRPGGSEIALAGATADSTGDGTLRDGDTAELLSYDTRSFELNQVPGFTGITGLAWSPDGAALLTILNGRQLQLYRPGAAVPIAPLAVTLPAGLEIFAPQWSLSSAGLPLAPTAVPTQISIATPTRPPTLTPRPSPFVPPTIPPSWTPFPTLTPFIPPTITPGSPMGVGCQFATALPPVMVGDQAEVTPLGGGLRLRSYASLTAPQLRELRRGATMTILGGPTCSDGYRWWQVRLMSDNTVGWLADSEPAGFWIQKSAPLPTPTAPMPAESIVFYSNAYIIIAGQCVTLTWAVEGIKEVYYQGQGVVGTGSRVECPPVTTVYTLKVVRLDNSVVSYPLMITVVTP